MKSGFVILVGLLILHTACNTQAAPTQSAATTAPTTQVTGTAPTAGPTLGDKAPTNPSTWTPNPSQTPLPTKTRVPSTPSPVPSVTPTVKAVATSTRQTGPGAISGTFTDSISFSFVSQKVQLLKAKDKIAEATVNGDGSFKFDKVQPGSYTLAIKVTSSTNVVLCDLNIQVVVVSGATTNRNLSAANCAGAKK